MDPMNTIVAKNIKRLREEKKLSMEELSKLSSVSKSMLAQIEKGTANPSLGVLGKITSGLRIRFQELIQAPPLDSCLVHVQEMVPTKEVEGQYKVWTCFPYEDNQLVEIYRIEIEAGQSYISGGHGEKTREYISVLQGEITVEAEGVSHLVTAEDVLRFETDQIHTYRNDGKGKAVFSVTFLDYH